MSSVRSDPGLVAEIRAFGRFDTNACLQCGSCTISCELTGETSSFPRRTLRYGLLGLREPLRRSLAPWLCHYCGDCSTVCPRDAEPGEGMMTLRRYLAAAYDWTGLASKIYRSTAWQVGSLIAVGAVVLALIVLYHLYVVEMQLSDLTDTEFAGAMGLEHMFGTITVFTRVVFLISLFFLLTNAVRMYWLAMHRGVSDRIPLRTYVAEARALVVQVVTQRRLRDCDDKSRWYFHVLLVFGFVLMLIVKFFALEWFQTDAIHPLYHPQRWLGYLATAAILVGVGDIVIGRFRQARQPHRFSDPTDWILPVMLLLTVGTGIAAHVLRCTGVTSVMHCAYAAHVIVAVPLLLVEIPFGKLSHMIYRPLGVYFHAVRERAARERAGGETVLRHAS